jgi:diacylglycerol kinase family enzyme
VRSAVLYNPIAGRGRAVQVAGSVSARLQALGHGPLERRSERAGHIRALAAEVAGEVDRVLVLGGDGSLREAAAGLLEVDGADRPELGVLPFGTGNVVARELGLPLDPVVAIDTIAAAGTVDWDVGRATADGGPAEIFLAMAGFGFDAGISARIDAARRGRLGARWYRWSANTLYGWCGLRELLRLAPPRFEVSVGGEARASRAVSAIASNTRTYGKSMWLSPGARPDDGHLDLHVRERANPLVGATVLALAQLQRPISSRLATDTPGATARIASIPGGKPLTWQLDGDRMEEAREVLLEVSPRALRLIGRLAS